MRNLIAFVCICSVRRNYQQKMSLNRPLVACCTVYCVDKWRRISVAVQERDPVPGRIRIFAVSSANFSGPYLCLCQSLSHKQTTGRIVWCLHLECSVSKFQHFSDSILDMLSLSLFSLAIFLYSLYVYIFHTNKQPVGLSDVCYLECSVSKFPLCLGSILDLIY